MLIQIALILGAFAQDPTLEQVAKDLKDPDRQVRHAAVNGLLRFDARQRVPLVLPLLRDADGGVRAAAVYVAASSGGAAVADDLLPLVKDPDSQVRRIASYQLGALRIQKAIPSLLELMDGDETDADSARFALAHLKTPESVAALLTRLRGDDLRRRNRALDALVDMKAREAIPDFVKLLADPGDLSRHATWALEVLDAKEAIPDVIRLAEHRTPAVRVRALDLLGRLGTPEQVAPPTRLRLLDPEKEVRRAAAAMLRRLRSPESAKALSVLLGDPDEGVRLEVVLALGALDAKDHSAQVRPSLEDRDAEVRGQAARTLARLGDRDAIGAIARLLQDADPGVRAAAIESLGRLGAVERAADVAAGIDDPEDAVRDAAARWACVLGSDRGVPRLLEQGTGLWPLNALARKDAWIRWSRPGFGPRGFNLPGPEALEAMAEAAGDSFAALPPAAADWHTGRLCEDQAGWITLGEELHAFVVEKGFEAVLGPDGVRLLPREKALESRRAWWKAR